MPTIAEVRQQYPQYSDMSDSALADALHSKFYSDMPRTEFDKKIGLAPPTIGGVEFPALRTVTRAVSNAPASAAEFAKNTISPLLDPVGTAQSIGAIGKGVLQKFGIVSGNDSEKYADAVGKFFVDRYGSLDKINETLATDPVGALADLSTVLTMGGSAAARAPGAIGKAGEIVRTVGNATNPIALGVEAAKPIAKLTAKTVGELGTGAGDALIKAGEAGAAGVTSPESKAFLSNLSGMAPTTEVVDKAKAAVTQMRADRAAEYTSGMIPIKNDYKILDFSKIDAAIQKVEDVKKFKGVDLSPKTKEIRNEIKSVIDEWRNYPAAQYHTPGGIDALKQMVGDIVQNAQPGSPARVIGDQIYKGIWQTIKDQAPTYAKVMGDYEDASKLIKEIQDTLSLKPGARVDTALRKLQSVLRNNANTNYGRRAELMGEIEAAGGGTVPHALAGQALNTVLPRGLVGRLLAGGATLASGAGAAHGLAAGAGLAVSPWALAALPMSSPALMGTAAYGLGAASRYGQPLGLGAFQAGRLPQ